MLRRSTNSCMNLAFSQSEACTQSRALFGRRSAIVVAFFGALPTLAQSSVGTAFTYQGRLESNGSLVTGAADVRFALEDQPGTTISTRQINNVQIQGGLFTATP